MRLVLKHFCVTQPILIFGANCKISGLAKPKKIQKAIDQPTLNKEIYCLHNFFH